MCMNQMLRPLATTNYGSFWVCVSGGRRRREAYYYYLTSSSSAQDSRQKMKYDIRLFQLEAAAAAAAGQCSTFYYIRYNKTRLSAELGCLLPYMQCLAADLNSVLHFTI